MRRKDREVTDITEIVEIIKKCDCCNLALFDEEYPYVVPLNFGYRFTEGKLRLYFHGANAGTKLALMKKNPRAAFTMHTAHTYIPGSETSACEATMEYESVCGSGTLRLLAEEEKTAALTRLMQQYEAGETFHFDEKMVAAVAVLELSVAHVSGKRLKK